MSLVDMSRVKDHLKITHGEEDIELEAKVASAEAIVLDYVTDVGSPAWDEESVPAGVKAAILEVTANLWRHRGDDGTEDGPLTTRAMLMLRPHRDPPLA